MTEIATKEEGAQPVFDLTILDEAKNIVAGARQKAYGKPEDCFENIGRAWAAELSMWLKIRVPDIPGRVVSHMLSGMKLVRDCNEPKRDSLVDIVGYSLCASRFNN